MSQFLPFLVCGCSLFLMTAASSAPGQSSSNGIAAVVNGRVITKSEVRDAVNVQEQMLHMQYQNNPAALERELANLHETALDSLIDRELILAEFKRIGASIKAQWVDDDVNGIVRENFKGDRDTFVRELARNNMTLKKFREMREKMMIVQAMRAKQAAAQGPATPREVEEYYRKNLGKWRKGDMIKISTITIPKFTGQEGASADSQRKLANEIRAKVLKGGDFATMAKTYSSDGFSDAGGAREWMTREEMPPMFAEAAFSLKTGGISPVIDTEVAYIIIACDAIKYGNAPPLSELREEIERAISSEKSKAAVDKWMENLRRKANVKKFVS